MTKTPRFVSKIFYKGLFANNVAFMTSLFEAEGGRLQRTQQARPNRNIH